MSAARNFSDRVYVRLPREDVAFFRFSLEAQDGLALFTSLGADAEGRMTLMLRCAPGTVRPVLAWLRELATELPVELLPLASARTQ